ncbi:MAG: methyltransferase domain-containing protein [Methanobacteriota archaeon]|nr:MAG: methyltransferase domain-containing protein [Euryarchaeota archaeon]
MRIAFELSGEHPTLPRADALSALEAERVAIRAVSFTPEVLVVDALRPPRRALERVALSRYVDRVLALGPLSSVLRAASRLRLAGESFRVRAHGPFTPAEKRDLERRVGAAVPAGRVDLDRPDREFRLLQHGGDFLLGEVEHEVERSAMEARKVARRPFSMPISLHPKFARALVNLSRCPRGGALLDPFCGTGGIALEGARLGMRVFASDLQEKMVDGTSRALAHYGLKAQTFVADVGDVPLQVETVDAIATDPPYGRAASTRGEPPNSLYRRAFGAFRGLLRPGGHAAVVLPSDRAVAIGEEFLGLEEAHTLRVHKSLTRTFCAFVKPP